MVIYNYTRLGTVLLMQDPDIILVLNVSVKCGVLTWIQQVGKYISHSKIVRGLINQHCTGIMVKIIEWFYTRG